MVRKRIKQIVNNNGKDIIKSSNVDLQKKHIQHGSVSVFEHSFSVACLSVFISKKFHINVNQKSLVRGALLHDYFLYDWHIKSDAHKLHGFTHASSALKNAEKEFLLNPIEKDIIKKHMFPLNITPPKYKETVIVCIADKLCALWELTSHITRYNLRVHI